MVTLVGTLTKKQGLKDGYIAEINTEIFEEGDKYLIIFTHPEQKLEKTIFYYKKDFKSIEIIEEEQSPYEND